MILNREDFFDFINEKNVFIYNDSQKLTYNLGNRNAIDAQISDNCDVYYFNEDTVAYFRIFHSLYHFYIDEMSLIFNLFKKDRNCLFLIETNANDFESIHLGHAYLKDFFKILEDFKIKYKIIYNKNNKKIAIFSKSTYIRKFSDGRYKVLVEDLMKTLSVYINNSLPTDKKVYLSRSMVNEKYNFLEMNKVQDGMLPVKFKTDKRINDENLIEEFFKKYNFEIINPEKFNSLFDQLNYMNSVKLLVSATSAGLTNCIFMKKNQKVIELSTDIAIGGQEEVHSFFLELCFIMNHQYINIPHLRKASDIIKSFTNNKYLMELINE